MVEAGLGFLAGMIVAYLLIPQEDGEVCPRRVLGYSCHIGKNGECDHRRSEYYRAKMNIALNEERKKNNPNYWKGDGTDGEN